jgi:hypothetical protein
MKQRKGNLSYHTTNYFVSYVGKESLKNTIKGWFSKEATTSSPPHEDVVAPSPPHEDDVPSSPPSVQKRAVHKMTPRKKKIV